MFFRNDTLTEHESVSDEPLTHLANAASIRSWHTVLLTPPSAWHTHPRSLADVALTFTAALATASE